LTPDGILIVEETGVVEADEELAVGTVWALRPGHRAGAAHVRRLAEFGLEVGKLAPAHPAAGGIASLRHETRDDPVENDAIVKSLVGEIGNPLDMAGRQIRAKLDDDV